MKDNGYIQINFEAPDITDEYSKGWNKGFERGHDYLIELVESEFPDQKEVIEFLRFRLEILKQQTLKIQTIEKHKQFCNTCENKIKGCEIGCIMQLNGFSHIPSGYSGSIDTIKQNPILAFEKNDNE